MCAELAQMETYFWDRPCISLPKICTEICKKKDYFVCQLCAIYNWILEEPDRCNFYRLHMFFLFILQYIPYIAPTLLSSSSTEEAGVCSYQA